MADSTQLTDELPLPKKKRREPLVDKPKDEPSEEVRYWLSEIAAAKKREKDFRSEGKRIRDIYSGEKKDSTPFNVLFSNTETMVPALYSAIPRPVVQRRYKDEDPIGKAAALAAQRYLEFQLDTNLEGYETFDDSMKALVLDGLLPGRGITTVKYDAQMGQADGAEVKVSDTICTCTESWDRFLHGYARRWQDVPWTCFEKYIDKEEAARLFGEAIAGKVQFTKGEEGDENESGTKKEADERHTGERKTALVYQIWDRAGGKVVRYVSPHYKDGYLLEQPDPLGLSGFFNTPRPLKFIEKTDDLLPTSLYTLYENQANELNSLTVRISRLVKAIKARGVYDSALGDDIGDLMEADDNELIPATQASSLANPGGFDKSIWFMPLDVMVMTLKELYVAREQTKQTIYEIIGIADILRGASQASETLGAQQIKTQWGTLRLRPKQAEVQRYARDLLRMMVEIAAKQFSEDTWARMTGLPFLTEQQAAQLMQTAQLAQDPASQMDPNILQQAQAAQAQLQSTPPWSGVLAVLKDDLQRSFKIDIETNSTIQPEAAEDQKNIADLLNALGQYLQQIGPMVIQGILPFETAQSMLLAITRRFRFGNEIEDQIKQMKPPPPPPKEGDDGAAQKQQLALTAENAQLKTQLQAMQTQAQLQQKAADLDKRELSLQVDQQQLGNERELFRLEQQRAQESLVTKAQGETQKIEYKRQLTGLEQKKAKEDQGAAKNVDQKTAAAVAKFETLLSSMADNQAELGNLVSQHTQQIQHIAALAKAPRRRKAIRDQSGRIVAAEDEPITTEGMQ